MVVTLQLEAVQQACSDNSFADSAFDKYVPEALVINTPPDGCWFRIFEMMIMQFKFC
jgi:hypothetical protein